MKTKKSVYPAITQKKILQKAKETITIRYGNDPSVLAIYLGGSAIKRQLGIYKTTVRKGGIDRLGSDIDVMLVIEDRNEWCPLTKADQKRYGVQHIGLPKEALYNMVDEKDGDILLHNLHPIELIIMTKDFFLGCLSGKYRWGRKPRKFSEDVKSFKVIKETEEIRKVRKIFT